MKHSKRYFQLSSLALLALVLVSTGCQKLKARDELNKGVAAFKGGQYPVAVEHFKGAIEADPSLTNARLYLATAYASQYVPGADSESNTQVGEQAIAEFQKILQGDPNNIGSISGIASLYFQMKKFDEAKEYYRKHVALDPKNAEAFYSIGVINWTETYQPRMELKKKLNLRPDEPIKDAKERAALREKNLALVDEGMQMLDKAMAARPDYDDAMAYQNLLLREKADLVDDPAEREALLKQADDYVNKSLDIKKKKSSQETTGQVTG